MKRFPELVGAAAFAAACLCAQTATGGTLFTHTGTADEWFLASDWTGGTGFPDEPTEDARLVSSSRPVVNISVDIGGIQGDAGSLLFIGRINTAVGNFTLHGISGSVDGGTAAFDSSSLDRLEVRNDGIFANTRTSVLTVNNLQAFDTALVRSSTNSASSMTIDGSTQSQLWDQSRLENAGNLNLNVNAQMANTSIVSNESLGTLTQLGRSLNFFQSSRLENTGLFLKNGGAMTFNDTSVFLNTADFIQADGATIARGGARIDNDSNYTIDGGTTNIAIGSTLFTDGRMVQNGGVVTVEGGGRLNNESPFDGYRINGGTLDIQAGGLMDGFGIIHLHGGTLRVDGQISQDFGIDMTGGVLQGTGTVGAAVGNTGGTVGPGNSAGTLTIDGNYIQGAGGALAIEIESLLSFDILDVLGAADLDGTLDLLVDAGYAATAQVGDSFKIMNWTSFTGSFATVNGLNFGVGLFFTLDYGTDGLTLTVAGDQIAAAPEPGMLALFLCGGLLIVVAARRRPAPVRH
jgi:hypothetical protein